MLFYSTLTIINIINTSQSKVSDNIINTCQSRTNENQILNGIKEQHKSTDTHLKKYQIKLHNSGMSEHGVWEVTQHLAIN